MAQTATVQIEMPEMGESVTEGIVLEWHVAEGDFVNEGDTVVEISTDKVDAEVPAPTAGVITKLLASVDDEVPVGAPLAEMEPGEDDGTAEGSNGSTAGPDAESPPAGGAAGTSDGTAVDGGSQDVRATPVARRVASELGVDLGGVAGSGPGSKVTKEDVVAAADGGGNGATAIAPATTVGEGKQLRGPAAMLASAMNESRAVPTATSFRTVAVDTLDAKRKALNGVLKDRGMKVSFTHLVAWAIVQAAKDWPVMVRTYEERDGKPFAIEGGSVNLGIAVDVERKDGSHSLMVPAIKGADGLGFAAFHAYYEDLIKKTRESKLSPDDFQGTNISLTNPGGIGTVASVPRLMSGQSAIIATGSIAYPSEWAHAGADRIRQLGVSKVMTLTSTYDHRVIQGAESGSFLRRIEQLLQGEDGFYEAIASDLGVDPGPIASAHPASASAPPLGMVAPTAAGTGAVDEELLQAVQAATSLLKGYRTHGHLAARLDPLGSEPRGDPAIQPESLNLTPELMERIPASILRIGVPGETLLEALPRMREAYCGTMAYQFEHIASHQQRIWLREMIETGAHRKALSDDERRRLLDSLIDVFQFERFLEKAYLGQKMFSIEGLDVVVPMLDELVTLAYRGGAEEVVFGMAHRGRLSVLAHNLGRPVEAILAEFEGDKRIEAVKAVAAIPHGGTGDVKYHYGHQGTYESSEGEKISIRLYPNPSHLEFVDPVVTGGARFLQSDIDGPTLTHDPKRAVPVLLHGDASFPAQGVVAETLNLQSLKGYSTGGTIHIVQNNQVGFTTDPEEARSTPYAADMAKGFNVPIVHVNADDPEACSAAVRLAMAYRERWGRDIVIDVIGYRRFGHNETDEPAYTQPLMAAKIKAHPPVSEIYAEKLAAEGVVSAKDVERASSERREEMSAALKGLREKMETGEYEDPTVATTGTGELDRTASPPVDTAVPAERLRSLNQALLKVPESFTIHRKLRRPLSRRLEAIDEGSIDFGHAEALAFASLLTEGVHTRLTGQDTERGTFSHRHLVLHDENTGLEYCPMQNLEDASAPFELHNSPLSEIACLGFEYGYSAATPERTGPLGGAVRRLRQRRPGHRRQLHRLRRGEVGPDQPPHPAAAPRLRGLGPRALQRPHRALPRARRRGQHPHRQPHHRRPVLPPAAPPGADPQAAAADRLHPEGPAAAGPRHRQPRGPDRRRVPPDPRRPEGGGAAREGGATRALHRQGLLRHGRSERREAAEKVAIARVEMLYPFARDKLTELIASYPNLKEIAWVQEEPRNMGAWKVMSRRMPDVLPEGVELNYIGRPARASPGEGYSAAHAREQERIVLTALTPPPTA